MDAEVHFWRSNGSSSLAQRCIRDIALAFSAIVLSLLAFSASPGNSQHLCPRVLPGLASGQDKQYLFLFGVTPCGLLACSGEFSRGGIPSRLSLPFSPARPLVAEDPHSSIMTAEKETL
jgi:hypothetical protein